MKRHECKYTDKAVTTVYIKMVEDLTDVWQYRWRELHRNSQLLVLFGPGINSTPTDGLGG